MGFEVFPAFAINDLFDWLGQLVVPHQQPGTAGTPAAGEPASQYAAPKTSLLGGTGNVPMPATAAAPSGSLEDFLSQVIVGLGGKVTPGTLQMLEVMAQGEGIGLAGFNPLATMQDMPG